MFFGRGRICTSSSPVVGGEEPVVEERGARLGVDLRRRREPLVESVEDGGDERVEPRLVHLGPRLQRVEPVLPERLDHVPQVHQEHCAVREKCVNNAKGQLVQAK